MKLVNNMASPKQSVFLLATLMLAPRPLTPQGLAQTPPPVSAANSSQAQPVATANVPVHDGQGKGDTQKATPEELGQALARASSHWAGRGKRIQSQLEEAAAELRPEEELGLQYSASVAKSVSDGLRQIESIVKVKPGENRSTAPNRFQFQYKPYFDWESLRKAPSAGSVDGGSGPQEGASASGTPVAGETPRESRHRDHSIRWFIRGVYYYQLGRASLETERTVSAPRLKEELRGQAAESFLEADFAFYAASGGSLLGKRLSQFAVPRSWMFRYLQYAPEKPEPAAEGPE